MMSLFDDVDLKFLRRRAALKWGRYEEDAISLSVADIDYKSPDFIKNSIIKAVEEDRTPYGKHAGDDDVLEVICEKLNRVNGIPASPDDVHMIPGTMFSIFVTCYYALSPNDQAVISPAPIYPPFIDNILNTKAVPVFNSVAYSPEKCRLDLEALESQITPATRLLMVCNPHNPCGLVLNREELLAIGRIAEKHDLLIFSDELYEDMVMDGRHISLASLDTDLGRRTITAYGFSKAFAIPGLRAAYLVNKGPHMEPMRKIIHDIIVHTDTLAQAAAKAALLEGGPWLAGLRDHLRTVRTLVLERLRNIPGVWCPEPQATPFLFPNFSAYGLSSEEMTKYLHDRAGVIVQSGANFGPPGEGHIRLNIGTSPSVLTEALDRIEGALKELDR